MMTAKRVASLLAVCACAFALAIVAGCSAPAASSSAASSESAASSSVEAASSAEASSTESGTEAASGTEPSADASATAEASQAAPQAESGSADSLQTSIDAAKTLGYQIFEGTVRVLSTDELAQMQDADTKMFPQKGTHAVLIFDTPTEVTGVGGGDPDERTETADMLGIAEYTDYDSFVVQYGDVNAMEAYDGAHVTLAAQDITFPSDVRLPLGQPSASDVKILS